MFKFGQRKAAQGEILSPLTGEAVPLNQVQDQVFSTEMMGKGMAIKPTVGKVVAPVTGKIQVLFPTKHAIGLTSDAGAEILIHIGIDTVELNGQHFEAFVKEGDKVKAGDTLVTFDIAAIEAAGYPTITPVIVTNSDDYSDITPLTTGAITAQQPLLNLVKK